MPRSEALRSFIEGHTDVYTRATFEGGQHTSAVIAAVQCFIYQILILAILLKVQGDPESVTEVNWDEITLLKITMVSLMASKVLMEIRSANVLFSFGGCRGMLMAILWCIVSMLSLFSSGFAVASLDDVQDVILDSVAILYVLDLKDWISFSSSWREICKEERVKFAKKRKDLVAADNESDDESKSDTDTILTEDFRSVLRGSCAMGVFTCCIFVPCYFYLTWAVALHFDGDGTDYAVFFGFGSSVLFASVVIGLLINRFDKGPKEDGDINEGCSDVDSRPL